MVLTLEPLRHLVGNWEREVRRMDFHRALMLTEPGKVEKCYNLTMLILTLCMLSLALCCDLKE